jgi:hypothetical protein
MSLETSIPNNVKSAECNSFIPFVYEHFKTLQKCLQALFFRISGHNYSVAL